MKKLRGKEGKRKYTSKDGMAEFFIPYKLLSPLSKVPPFGKDGEQIFPD
jgi:hypothetical protein